MSDDGKTVTMKDGVSFGMGGISSTVPNTLVAGGIGSPSYFTSGGVSGETYARYNKLVATAAGTGEFIAGRDRTVLSAAVSNAHGVHDSLEVSSTGYVTGLGTAVRGNVVVTNTAVPAGTYYGVLAEIYASGNTSALPAASNACLGINLQAGTAMDAVGNAISFSGTSSATSMVDSHNLAIASLGNITSSVRVLVNGAVRYIPLVTARPAHA
jgi:hypothetical protein